MKPAFRSFLILCCIAISAVNSGCEKRFLDYRNKYTGDFDITVTTNWWGMGGSGTSTEHLDGRVYYDKQVRQMIRIEYNNTYINLDIDKKGELSQNNNVVGKFDSKNEFTIMFGNYAPGGSSTQTYVGKRKK